MSNGQTCVIMYNNKLNNTVSKVNISRWICFMKVWEYLQFKELRKTNFKWTRLKKNNSCLDYKYK